ncbi:hypothetical protein J6590_028263 [Homalodisca vitripennis]|nr:hypothetical protein J6590_028263 [Homalodisca vitripennis]
MDRKAALKVAISYRTVSESGVQVIARVMANYLKAQKQWMERQHSDVSFFLTKFLASHDHFGSTQDDVERWTEERRELMTQLEEDLQPQTIIVRDMLRQKCWNMVAKYVEKILRAKKGKTVPDIPAFLMKIRIAQKEKSHKKDLAVEGIRIDHSHHDSLSF